MPASRPSVSEQFGDIWPLWNKIFVDILVATRKHVDGDLDTAVILAVVAERTLTSARSTGLTFDDLMRGHIKSGSGRLINTQSLADCTGIPRESVRRKVRALIERGWLYRRSDGTLTMTLQAAREGHLVTEQVLLSLQDLRDHFARLDRQT